MAISKEIIKIRQMDLQDLKERKVELLLKINNDFNFLNTFDKVKRHRKAVAGWKFQEDIENLQAVRDEIKNIDIELNERKMSKGFKPIEMERSRGSKNPYWKENQERIFGDSDDLEDWRENRK